jgi:DNA-binding response OmpR family regulator
VQALVLDHNEEDCTTMMDYLRQGGYSVLGVASVTEARKAFEEETFDVLLLESALPDGDSFTLCNEIRERLGDNIIIIFVSANNTAARRTSGIQLGADDFLGKPCNAEELLARISARQRRRQVSRELFAAPRPCQGW